MKSCCISSFKNSVFSNWQGLSQLN